jgi:hypothetical protein
MSEDSTKPALAVVPLREFNLRDIPDMMRKTAAAIEAGDYGVVGEVALVLMGDTLEVFGWGRVQDGTSTAALLGAGHLRLLRACERHGREDAQGD